LAEKESPDDLVDEIKKKIVGIAARFEYPQVADDANGELISVFDGLFDENAKAYLRSNWEEVAKAAAEAAKAAAEAAKAEQELKRLRRKNIKAGGDSSESEE
jgi:hypothetical protein